ncbi:MULTISPECIES: hypothetical protein [unclassified Paenibacillus]|uniref:hypothetical protein n=1 Tax=unclassified Paenibacillus TaxID=185978 RepID=UPI0008391037|nr:MULTISPECIES: hypothetical protein [unclassified Paenibacillus]
MALGQNQVIYEAHPNTVKSVKDFRDQMHRVGQKYVNHNVRVQTIDGVTYEGQLIHLDGGLLFLSLPGSPGDGQWQGNNPWSGHELGQGQGHHDGHPWNWDGHGANYGYPQPRGLYGGPYYNNVILPLVLYELLVISLL